MVMLGLIHQAVTIFLAPGFYFIDILLVNSLSTIEICNNGVWKRVCEPSSIRENLLCKELGFYDGSGKLSIHYPYLHGQRVQYFLCMCYHKIAVQIQSSQYLNKLQLSYLVI